MCSLSRTRRFPHLRSDAHASGAATGEGSAGYQPPASSFHCPDGRPRGDHPGIGEYFATYLKKTQTALYCIKIDFV